MTLNNTIYAIIAVMMFFELIAAGAETSTSLSDADFRRIDNYIETQLKEANIPGAALVIVEGNQITHLRGFGVAGPDGQPMTPKTGFFLGSVSKSFTALAIMQLVEAGQIDLEAPVQKYLPWFRVADPKASSQMKVRHLLNHTSGLSTYAGRTHLNSSDMSNEAMKRRVRSLHKAKLTAPVGKGTNYSNANYHILGAIIESVSGQSYENYIQEHIFDPLNMTNSYTSEESARQHNLATGYRYWFGKPFAAIHIPHSRGDLAAGYLISCANDMGNYLLALMNRGVLGDTQILSENGISKLHTPERKDLNYGMGWGIGKIHNTRVISHDGSTPGFHTEIAIFPDYQRAFCLLINAENWLSGPAIGALCWHMKSLIIGKQAYPIMKAPKVHIYIALLCFLLLSQVIRLALISHRIYRWCKCPDTLPERKRWSLWMRGSVSCIVNIVIAVGMLWLVPQSQEVPLSGIILYAPDAGWLLLSSGILAIIALFVSISVTAVLIKHVHIKTINAEDKGVKY